MEEFVKLCEKNKLQQLKAIFEEIVQVNFKKNPSNHFFTQNCQHIFITSEINGKKLENLNEISVIR